MADEYPPLRRFLLPEKQMSLKLVFDNARNYVIIGAFVAMARWFRMGKATPVPYVFTGPPKNGWGQLMWLCLAVAAVLFLLNVMQSYFIGKSLLDAATEVKPVEGGKPARGKAPWYVHFGIWVLALTATMVLIAVVFLLSVVAVYMVWYAAVGAK